MHGRLKVRTTEEQRLIKEKEQQKKLAAYKAGMKCILSTRNKETYDPDSFAISSQILTANPDLYTLWNFRKEVILIEIKKNSGEIEGCTDALIKFLENEIKFTEQCLIANPKSYSSWYHRYWVLQRHPKPNWGNEFLLCTRYLSKDDRNLHCWDYRRLILNKIGGVSVKDELGFTRERLNENFSNYTSWHYRSTLRKLDEKTLEEELKLVESAVFTDPFDSSAWFYLRWVLSQEGIPQERRQGLLQSLNELQEIEPQCKWILIGKCWLSGDLNQANDLEKCYQELIKLDPLRKGQYQHYLAKK